MSPKKKWPGRVYLGRDADGKQRFRWIGRFDTKRERDAAVALARVDHGRGGELPNCDRYVEVYLADYGRRNKPSSADAQRQRLKRFARDFAGRSIDIPRAEAKEWVYGEGSWRPRGPVPSGQVPAVISLYNHAIDEDDLPLDRNPFRGLAQRAKGRADKAPPTDEEFQRLLEGCSALGDFAPMMRALTTFAAYSLMRPSELYALEWDDIDFDRMRINKARAIYKGRVSTPKYGPKIIALTPPARDALLPLDRERRLVFTNKRGGRLSAPALSGYWSQVRAAAELNFVFYHATKHYGVHYLWTKLGLSSRAIAAQAGWSVRSVDKLLAVYGHGEVGALEEVDGAFADNVTPLRKVEGGRG